MEKIIERELEMDRERLEKVAREMGIAREETGEEFSEETLADVAAAESLEKRWKRNNKVVFTFEDVFGNGL